MSNRTVWFFVGGVLVGVLVLAGIGAAVAAMSGAFGARGTVGSVSQETTTFGVTHIFIRQEAYSPPRIQVLLSTTVTWTNKDNVPHNVTITPVVISAADAWESGQLYPGQSFTYTFTSRGTFRYYCQDHPGMVGIVTVT
jgi:plastocyanin